MTSKGEVDLHIHTTASSDGQHSPEEIFRMAHSIGLKAISFADHNSVDHIDEGFRLSEESGIELIPCFELNTLYDNMDLHILGFFVEHREPEFHRWLDDIHEAKREQAKKRLKALQSLDFAIDAKSLETVAQGRIPTGSTFLDALLSRKEGRNDPRLRSYIDGEKSDSPAFNFYRDYFRKDRPAFVPLEICPTEVGIRRIKEFGGIPVQAHPSDTGDEIIERLIEAGLMGLEAYSSYHNPAECEHFRAIAQKHDILVTAGSDFHGKKIKPNVDLSCISGNNYEVVEKLKDARKRL